MKLLDKILVPVALEKNLNSHLNIALRLAKKFKSQIILIYVLPLEARQESVNKYVLKHVKQELDALINDFHLEEVTIQRIIEYGNTFDRIVKISEDEDVNLILFSNFIEQQNVKYNMDVVAEKLVRKSDKPVWVVKGGDEIFPNSMLCTVDFSDSSGRALNNALKIARTFKKRLHILNINKPMENNFSPRYTIDLEEENKKIAKNNKKLFEDFLSGFNFTDVDYEIKVETGDPAIEILSFVSRNNIDLLFMGATGKTYLQRVLLGSVTEKLIRELPCSMVVTKAESILNLQIDSDISEIEKLLSNAKRLEETGFYEEAIRQFKLSIQKNDLHIPSLNGLARLYEKIGEAEKAEIYRQKIDAILRRLWDKKIEFEIRKQLGY
jgi:universal stress protein E